MRPFNPNTANEKTYLAEVYLDNQDYIILPSVNQIARRVTLFDTGGNAIANGLNLAAWDYVARVLTNSTTETYTFRSGGSGGTVTNTVVIVYTDSTLATLLNVTKT